MNIRFSCGLAALALLALAPCARALVTTTQNFSQQGATHGYGGNGFQILGSDKANLGGTWDLTPAEGGLTSVVFNATVSVQATSWHMNIFGGMPWGYQPGIHADTKITLLPGTVIGSRVTYVIGDEVILAPLTRPFNPLSASTFSTTITHTFDSTFTDAASLARFFGAPELNFRTDLGDDTSHGSLDFAFTLAASLTYVYDMPPVQPVGAPSGGNAGAMLAFALVGMLGVHRRMKRRLPTE